MSNLNSPAKVKTVTIPTLISLQSDSHVRSQAILSALLEMTWLDLWFVGLMPEVVRIDEWQWDAPVLSPNSDASSEVKWDEDEAEDWIQNADLYELNPKQKLILGMNLKGWNEAQVIAKLNFLLLLKAEKGAVLPQEWIDALTGELPIYWSKNQSITPSWLLRIVKAFGHDVSAPPDGKPDPTGVWVGDKTPFVGKGVKWSGPILTTSEGMEHSYLQQADFGGFLLSIATEIKEENTLLLYDTLWVQWKHEGIFLPGIRRENRNYYTIRFGATHRWVAVEDVVDCPHSLWGNQLIRWAVNGASSGAISKAVNRDATQLVAPSRLYGDPSTLNRSQDHNTVGHLEMGLPSWGVHYTGPGSMLPDMLSDCDSFAPIRAAEFAYQDGLPVLYQHQLENVRVGEIAAACGKSTVNVTVKCKDGMLKTIQVAIGQFLVDKATKLFNRDSLLGRCPAIVHIFRKGAGNPEVKKALSTLKAKAKGLLNKG